MEKLTHEQRALADAAFAQRINVVHHAYVDITGDLVAGALLGQILYWFGADRGGQTRARIVKDGYTWIAKTRGDWHDEIRITPKQYDRAIKILKDKGLVKVTTFKFAGNPTTHIRIVPEAINQAIDGWKASYARALAEQQESPQSVAQPGYSPLGNNDIPQTGSPLLTFGEQPSSPLGNKEVDVSGISSYTEITNRELGREHGQASSESAHYSLSEMEKQFETIWAQYPKKEGKAQARHAYIKAITGQSGSAYTPEEILVETILYRHHIEKQLESGETSYRYIPSGAKWFEREGWTDDYPSIAKTFDDLSDSIAYSRGASKMRTIAEKIATADEGSRQALSAELDSVIQSLPYQ